MSNLKIALIGCTMAFVSGAGFAQSGDQNTGTQTQKTLQAPLEGSGIGGKTGNDSNESQDNKGLNDKLGKDSSKNGATNKSGVNTGLGLQMGDFSRLDVNSDGSLSTDEMKADGNLSAAWRSMDTDRNGKLSSGEFSRGVTVSRDGVETRSNGKTDNPKGKLGDKSP